MRTALDARARREGGPELRRRRPPTRAGPPAASRRSEAGRQPRAGRARGRRRGDQGRARPSSRCISQEIVGPVIGADLQRKGIYATLASIVGITIYIGIRFRFAFAIGAIAATLHDVLVTLAFLAFFGYDLSLNIVAAHPDHHRLLGERHHRHLRPRAREPAQRSGATRSRRWSTPRVNQTLGRTIITAGTTFLAVLSLYLFGGEVLEGFAFTMLVGIVSGTYSTVFIAAAIAILLGNRRRRAAARGAGEASRPPPRGDRRHAAVDLAGRGAARRGPGTHRVPAGVELAAHLHPGARASSAGTPAASASPSTSRATSARCWRWSRTFAATSRLTLAAPGALAGRDGAWERAGPADRRRHECRWSSSACCSPTPSRRRCDRRRSSAVALAVGAIGLVVAEWLGAKRRGDEYASATARPSPIGVAPGARRWCPASRDRARR